jgi:hypothetical protein
VDVDRAAYVSLETRVEQAGRILQGRALGERKLHDILVGFASSAEGFPTPVPELGDPFRNPRRRPGPPS